MHWKAIALVVVTWSAPSLALAQVFEPFVETGDAVPSTALTVSDLGVPRIGADQDLAVEGTMEGDGVDASNDAGLFVYRSGRSIEALAARLGETLMGADGPSTSAVDFRLLPGSVLVFRSSWVASDGIGLDGVWRWTPGGDAAPVALSRGDVAGSATLRWRVFDTLRAGPSGAAVHWHCGLSDRAGSAYKDAIGGTDGEADAAVRVANLPGEYPAHSMFSTHRRASGSGHWALSVTRREAAGAPSERVILRDGTPIVREGELGGLDVFSVVGINDAGRVIFLGGMRGSPNSLYAFDDAASPLAAPGGAVPGLDAVTWAASNFSDLRRFFVGGGGHVVVAAALDGAAAGTDEALLVFDPELMALRTAVRAGDPAPGLSAIRFAALTRTASSVPENTLAINARGDVLFRAQLEGGDISAATRESLWVYHYADDALTLLLRQGQEVEVDGAPYTLRDFGVQLGSGGQDGLPTGYADDGGVALRLDLDEELPGGGVGRQRRFVGRADDRRQLVRIGSAPIGVPLPDAGMEDGGLTMTPTTPPRGGCSVNTGERAAWTSFGMLFLLLLSARRRRNTWLALGVVSMAVLGAATGCSSVREIVADAGPHDAATARPADASVVDQDASMTTDGGLAGADAGRDAGMLVVAPPPGPVKTVRRPERARRGRGRIPPPVITISTDRPVLLVPGADEVAVHALATGDIVHRYPTQAQPYATLWLEAGGATPYAS